MTAFLFVFLGGGIGASLRYGVHLICKSLFASLFPWATVLVNIVGSFLIGYLMSFAEGRSLLTPKFTGFLITGILGGFTTFSAFSFETVSLLRSGEWGPMALNVVISIVGGLVACILGLFWGRS